jgi:hypothetical protein
MLPKPCPDFMAINSFFELIAFFTISSRQAPSLCALFDPSLA